MNPAAWGGLCALSWGTADFIARFTGRGAGVQAAMLGVLVTGATAISLWIWLARVPLVWPAGELWLLGVNGALTLVATLLLYAGLARGPISVVAPIVGAYPAIVVVFAVIGGTRPALVQWLAIAATMVGVAIVARTAEAEEHGSAAAGGTLRSTVLIALGAALAFALALISVQYAVPVFGNVQTLWSSRLVSLALLLMLFTVRRNAPVAPARWWPLLVLQGLLDAGGYVLLYEGSAAEDAELAAVASSAFGAVTTVMAWVFLRERIGLAQWGGIVLIFAGVAVLSR
jgi:drug/metabolite transporter (DMT)-like permease